ncbi:MAG TPA: cation diffusion facilitator family transporter [Candidatus Omnitrophota bacterium]|nr:cation diffusion facilitator family transporter [Candidatus Omnitrophota bacterium]
MSDQRATTGHRRPEVTASHISIAGATLIFLISLAAGIISDSVALLIDAATGLVILMVAFFVRFIIHKIDSPPDHEFHFGYGKYEPLAGVLQNIAILTTCLLGINFAIQDIIHPDDITNYPLSVAASCASGILALGLGVYLRAVALRNRSGVLKTAGTHWFADSVLSFSMCFGFLSGAVLRRLGYENISMYVDPVMAVLLCLALMKLPLQSIAANVSELLDAAPKGEIRHAVKKIVEQHKPDPFRLHRLRFRKAGKRIFLDVCFLTYGKMSIREAETLTDQFEKNIAAEFPHCDVVTSFKSAANEYSS